MALPLGIKTLDIRDGKFTNAHGNFTQEFRGQSFEVTVSDPEFKQEYKTFKEKYNKTTENLQWLIKNSIDNKSRLRAMGSGWSFTKIAVCEDGIINTKKLRLMSMLPKEHISQSFIDKGGDPGNFLFAQCGNTIIDINDYLEKEQDPPKSLKACGGSNGQTIAGALSSGTHGAAFKTGAISECIVGMHIVTGPDRHVWLEKASNRVTSDEFTSFINAEVIIDDDIFNSAVVSFGSFGIIHSLLIEVEPKFLLEQQLKRVAYNDSLIATIQNGDFTGLASSLKYALNDTNNKLYHFELALNPHDFEKDSQEKGVYLRVMYKQDYRTDYTLIKPDSDGFTYGDDVVGIMQLVLDRIESLPGKLELLLIPKIVNALFKVAYDRPETACGTLGETFRNTIFRGKLFSAAFSFNRMDIPKVVDIALDINTRISFAGIMAMRFVKGTKATMGFTMFEDTCVLELDGADTAINYKFSEDLANRLEQENIPFGLHWGKMNDVLNKERVRRMYGGKVDTWLNHRKQLLSDEVREVFNNGFLERCGLNS